MRSTCGPEALGLCSKRFRSVSLQLTFRDLAARISTARDRKRATTRALLRSLAWIVCFRFRGDFSVQVPSSETDLLAEICSSLLRAMG